MAVRRIMEGTVVPIRDYIKSNISLSLADVRADRTDNFVNTNPPQDYLIFAKAIGYRTPCVFVLGQDIEFKQQRGQNFIDCTVGVQISCILDEKDAEHLEYKCWRYHDALHEILDRAELVSSDGKIKNKLKVIRSLFGDTVQIKSNINDSPFRKEFMLTLDVEHFEKE